MEVVVDCLLRTYKSRSIKGVGQQLVGNTILNPILIPFNHSPKNDYDLAFYGIISILQIFRKFLLNYSCNICNIRGEFKKYKKVTQKIF